MARHIAIALSGGVDSAVAAYLLKKTGAQVTALHLRFYASNPQARQRFEQQEAQAKAIAQELDLDWQVLDVDQKQQQLVVQPFINAYQQGSAPNPCITCNKQIKFGYLLDRIKAQGFDYLATGHYAQIIHQQGQWQLVAAQDQSKDQSYFLYQLTEQQLPQLLFPLGKLYKSQVKVLAKDYWPKLESTESFDICFLQGTSLSQFLGSRITNQIGEVVDKEGLVVGSHQGQAFYTIGQRQGLTIDPQQLKRSHSIQLVNGQVPVLYVVAKDPATNRLVVGTRESCFKQQFVIKQLSFVNQQDQLKWQSKQQLYALVKIRNTGRLVAGQIGMQNQQLLVTTKEALFAPAVGQAAVFYQKTTSYDRVVAGAIIDTPAAIGY